jgi:hypothetical protein
MTLSQGMALGSLGLALAVAGAVRFTVSAGSRRRVFIGAVMIMFGLANLAITVAAPIPANAMMRLAGALLGVGSLVYAAIVFGRLSRSHAMVWQIPIGLGLALTLLSYLLLR